LKAKITGNIKCNAEKNIRNCKSILERFKIDHICNGFDIKINGFVKTSPTFDRNGFQKMLHRKLENYGKININVGI